MLRTINRLTNKLKKSNNKIVINLREETQEQSYRVTINYLISERIIETKKVNNGDRITVNTSKTLSELLEFAELLANGELNDFCGTTDYYSINKQKDCLIIYFYADNLILDDYDSQEF